MEPGQATLTAQKQSEVFNLLHICQQLGGIKDTHNCCESQLRLVKQNNQAKRVGSWENVLGRGNSMYKQPVVGLGGG